MPALKKTPQHYFKDDNSYYHPCINDPFKSDR